MNKNINSFESCREVKWCPGCGNYAILKTVQKTLNSLGLDNNKTVFVSGIGCSGRFPYYINAHGFHTLHGRAIPVATGLKIINPDLDVWVVVGDGDCFSIGLGHILHLIRRNLDINILFINNKVYALTKGQYSPTSDINFISKSSPFGSIENPINPLLTILSAGCSFVARTLDRDFLNFKFIIEEAIKHKGTSFIEVLQNCNIFNNDVYLNLTDSGTKNERLLFLKHGKKFIFGQNNEFCLDILEKKKFTIFDNKNIINDKELPLHNILEYNILQIMLSEFSYYDIPYPIGIFRKIEKPSFNNMFFDKILKSKKINDFSDLFL